jgi:ATP-binding cassette subfamily B protein
MAVAEFVAPHPVKTDRRSPLRWIGSHVRRQWWVVLSMLIGAFGNAALAAVVPVLIGQAFTALSGSSPDLNVLKRVVVLIIVSQVLRGALQLGRNFSAELIGQRLERDIRDELYTSLLGKSMTFHSLQPVGDTMARATNDVREINLMFSPGVNLVVGSANFLLVPLIVAPSYHPSLILVPALFLVAYGLAVWQYLGELRPISEWARQAFGAMNARLAEAIDGIEVVKSTAQEDAEVERFSQRAGHFRDASVRRGDVEARFLPLLLLVLAMAGGFLHALILFRQGLLDVGQVVGYVGLLQLFDFPAYVSLFAYSQVSMGLASARRILELISRQTELDRNPRGYAGKMRGEIVFQHVSLSYDEGEESLNDVSFHVAAGQKVAIVGQTGSGKTTLAKLINRTYDASSGQVLIDGRDVRDWNMEALRRQISIIEQDVFLFSRSIAENIAFGRPGAAQAEIERAARAAQAHDFILEFAEGYQTVLGERGVTLSGGQRQRIALARAFLTDPRILILDDSTSAIDSATEDKIQQAIFSAAEGRTAVIITHRLSQIRWADLIVVLRGGQLVDVGKHDELMRRCEPYRRIFVQYEDV